MVKNVRNRTTYFNVTYFFELVFGSYRAYFIKVLCYGHYHVNKNRACPGGPLTHSEIGRLSEIHLTVTLFVCITWLKSCELLFDILFCVFCLSCYVYITK